MTMFMGSDGGILGVGTPEIITILLVGYFVLGAEDLYKLVKEIGKFVQNFRTLGTQATESFESSMEDSIDLQEMRKVQNELTDAFSFRRSINVDPSLDPFDVPVPNMDDIDVANVMATETTEMAATAGATAAAGVAVQDQKVKKRRRVMKKKKKSVVEDNNDNDGTIPDLDMTAAFTDNPPAPITTTPSAEENEAAELRAERMARLESGTQPKPKDANKEDGDDWYNQMAPTETDASDTDVEPMNRFQQQLAGDWNDQILANEDALSPMGTIMERLAILEQEKEAADARLQEEFQSRETLEQEYYQQKRDLLEQAAAEVQSAAYATEESSSPSTTSSS
eukprot:CAMPEP_0198295904 /NCGR_PEP_ID=MMETSP1449-20131203/30186_1 /TAXON_ID=420275 /ORGANISM="Attheya septentrionalis, Strain CCMP2084" /LENGTH=337 /DNA_ID=CAMNT_0043996339 /DNA_START=324 /DNA_END=1337 /DNA_ORIENTATION=+